MIDCALTKSLTASLHHSIRVVTSDWRGLVRYDQGTHDGCIFNSNYIKGDKVIRPVGSETWEQFCATERRGNTLKGVLTTVSKDMKPPVGKLRNMSSYRARAYKFFVRWDSDEKVRRAASTRASRIAMKHVQVNMDCSGALVLD